MNKLSRENIEILSPAGSFECFRAALNAGADAVYAGGQRFGARAYADNFSEDELIWAIREAHLFGKKLYLTVNTLLKDNEIRDLYDYLLPFYENGLDAVIVQDVGVLSYIRKCFPDLDIHISTQMTVTDLYGAKFFEKQGAVRVVPARELSLKEIRRIREGTNLEIECFVHGALCYCYSGQCLLSSMIGGRSGNRGQCAQPCRLPYEVNGDRKYFLSPKDICTLELIPDMIEAGINSFKIEGRMKKPEYVAAVTAVYRKYADLYLEHGRKEFRVEKSDREMLMDLYNRGGSSEGYYKNHNGREMLALDRPNHAGVPAAQVLSQKGREVCVRAVTDLHCGDVIRIEGKQADYTLGSAVNKGTEFKFLTPKGIRLEKGKMLFRIRNSALLDTIRGKYINTVNQKSITGFLSVCAGAPASLTVMDEEISCTVCTEEPVQKAQHSPLSEQQIRTRMMKTGNTLFYFDKIEIAVEEGVFLPMQQLNRLRRDALEQLERAMEEKFFRTDACPPVKRQTFMKERTGNEKQQKEIPGMTVLAETPEQLESIAEYVTGNPDHNIQCIYPDTLMTDDFFENRKISQILTSLNNQGIHICPVLPRIFRAEMTEWFENAFRLSGHLPLDGFMIRNYESFQFLREHGFDKMIILDHNLYVFNNYGKDFWKKLNVYMYTAPAELNSEELEKLGIREMELVVYGYLPVMVSAQCIQKTTEGCRKKRELVNLTDRYDNSFPVKNYCVPCYNVIYNTVPLWLGGQLRRIRELNPECLRVQFTVESAEETGKVLQMLGSEKRMQESKSIKKYTTGHFKRGIL